MSKRIDHIRVYQIIAGIYFIPITCENQSGYYILLEKKHGRERPEFGLVETVETCHLEVGNLYIVYHNSKILLNLLDFLNVECLDDFEDFSDVYAIPLTSMDLEQYYFC